MAQKIIANELPTIETPYKIAFIGESPGPVEAQMGRPFVGPSGNLLTSLMQTAKITRAGCLVGNVIQVETKQHVSALNWNGWEIQKGIDALREDVKKADPNIIVCMGELAMRVAGVAFTRQNGLSLTAMRGTLFECTTLDSPFYGRKCVGTFNPASIQRNWKNMPLLQRDVARARKEGETKELVLPKNIAKTQLTADEIIAELAAIPDGVKIAVDIEGYFEQKITVIGFSYKEGEAFCFAPNEFNDTDRVKVFRKIYEVLTDPKNQKFCRTAFTISLC